MNIKLNNTIIKERCGTVSYRKGDSFYRNHKVTFDHYHEEMCSATVAGTQDFQVTIEHAGGGDFHSTCSCPTLASFQKDCQHVAAVLLSIQHHQNNGTRPETSGNHSEIPLHLTESFLHLFDDPSKTDSKRQRHFEKREVLDASITCIPIIIGKENLLGIKISLNGIEVHQIRAFLQHLDSGRSFSISHSFSYDPKLHCFHNGTHAVLEALIHIFHDEAVYFKEISGFNNETVDEQTLVIPPSSWSSLLPYLEKAPLVKLEYDNNIYDGLSLSKETLSLQFDVAESQNKDYQLKITGLKHLVVLEPYSIVLSKGKLISLSSEDIKRLSYLKEMLGTSKRNQMAITQDQMEVFMGKVVPGLKRIGNVEFSGAFAQKFATTPLTAKLYLDRVKNRLLAGLEFQYENLVINPIEGRELQASSIIRDVEKEDAILKLLDESQFAKTEGGYYLHNEELEYEFLYHVVPKLQKLVQIYATTAVRNRIFRESAKPKIRIKLKKERTNWLEFKFDIEGIPEKHIRDILQALEEKRKYYRLGNGSFLSLEAREYEEIQRFLRSPAIQNNNEENSYDMPLVKGLQLLDYGDRDAFDYEASFQQFMKTLQEPGSKAFKVPANLENILREYQKHGYQWMKTLASYGFGGILADDMGLGKTIQSIAFISSELEEIRNKQAPVLIVCPSSVTYNWLAEIHKFTPEIKCAIVDGLQTERLKILKDSSEYDVIITSYPLLRKDIGSYEKRAFHTVFFDEAQAFKNPGTQTARAVKKINANYRFALTGTPIENSIEELWSIFHIVFPDLLRSLKEFSNLPRKMISKRIRPFLLRRIKEDVLAELPEKMESMESTELLPDQKKLYAAYLAKLRHETLKHLDKDTFRKNRIRILAGLTRLRQICCHPALFVDGYQGSSSKFNQLKQILEDARQSGRRVLIFSQFTKMLQLIGRDLTQQGIPYFYLDGQTPSKERVDLCQRFNEGEHDLMLISLKAGGTGLNLTGADTVILYDLWWNPAVEEQAADRAHRMGQKHTVQVIKLIARGTIEEKMNELQEKKRHLIEEIIDTDGKTPSALTEEDIREILTIDEQ